MFQVYRYIIHIYIYIYMDMKQDMPTLLLLFPYFFPINSLKLFLLSYDQESLMKPDTFEAKPSPSSCYIFILSVILSCSSFAYIEKNSENGLAWKSSWNKERNIEDTTKPELGLWFIQPPTYFYHTVRFTTIHHFNIHIYIYIFIYIYIYYKSVDCH